MTTAAPSSVDVLRAAHRPGDPLLLPNVWDAAAARAVVAAGFPAVATGSDAVAAALGYADGEAAPAAQMLAAAARIARAVDVPLTVDAERGYGLPPATLVARLRATGAVGLNLEDSDPRTGAMVPPERQVALLAAVRAAAGDALVLNARVDVALRTGGAPAAQVAEIVARSRAYLAAGADCVYPIWLADPADIGRVVAAVGGPVNILCRPGTPDPAALAALGVARVSFGPYLHRLALAAFAGALETVRGGAFPLFHAVKSDVFRTSGF
ncbi:isocitrate lyase/PEP mutase family protein [Pilimelia terevasa]|nr:isocitrate lyase/phosphoenolpyruvate mutase family protein [Pilimelia terevasa]